MSTFLFYKVKSSAGRFLALLIACACWLPSQGQLVQQGKSPLQLADQYFAAGEYYTAAYLYEQYLHPSKKNMKQPVFPVYDKRGKGAMPKGLSRQDILYKQAECYRLAHYWLNADSAYKQSTDNPDATYWSAVCERSLGKYDEAEDNIRKYLSIAGTNARFREAAEQELKTLQYIRKELSRSDSTLVKFRKLNTPDGPEKGAYAAVAVGDNKYLISSTQTGVQQAGGPNPHHARLYYATLNNDSLSQLTAVTLGSDPTPENQGAASISVDGNRIYFTQWKKENGRTVSSIYVTTKQPAGSWSSPTLLQNVNASGFNSKQPFIAADGKHLYFASDRPGGSGGFDIWYAPINADGTSGKPVNAGPMINTAGDEQAPFFHTNSNTLVFSTNGRQGMGGYDLFAAKGSEITWTEPTNLGHPINSSRDDIYFYAPENSGLLSDAVIGSDRGFGCCLESYNIKKAGKRKKLSGLVSDCKNSSPIGDALVTLTDPSGKKRTTNTDLDGNYSFDSITTSIKDLTLSISKPLFKDTTMAVSVGKTEESDLLVDVLFNSDICVVKKFVLKPENVVTVYFDFDKSVLKPEGIKKLDSVYTVMLENPGYTLQVSGYTDGKGSNDYNAKLSDRRARACANYLIAKGVDAKRITFESFGACCPVEMELINGLDNPDGRSKNRRALINITKE